MGVFSNVASRLSGGRKMAMRYHDATVASAIMSGGGGVWNGTFRRSLAINAGMGAAYGGVTDGDNRAGGAMRGALMGMGAGAAYRGALHLGVNRMGSGRSAVMMNRAMAIRSKGYRTAQAFAKIPVGAARGFGGHMMSATKARFAKKTP